ncbi:MAG: CPBP family intramembrane metalloprotease [Gemmatimonadaceae bacterium]|nr:CPBP family intramembrane metalloprotease [Gemmatimonadaceae bacterium]
MTLRRFLGQQAMLVGVLGLVMLGHRQITGRTLKGLQDVPHLSDLLLYLVVTAGLVWASAAITWRTRPGATLGIRIDVARTRHLLTGLIVGAALNALPWLIPLLQGTVVVEHRPHVAVVAVATGVGIALLNALFEEITSRAAPLALLAQWPAWRAVALTAFSFALMHGIGETLSLPRLAYLWALGVVLAVCWLRTGSVWLGTGFHAGWFWASLVPSGRMQSGALFGLRGSLGVALDIADGVLIVVALALLWSLHRGAAPPPTRGPMRRADRAQAASLLVVMSLFAGCTRDNVEPAMATASALTPWRMLEGRWRGTLNDTAPFYESYHFLDDSTVEVRQPRDAGDTAAPLSGTLRVRANELRTGNADMEWIAEQLTPERIGFAPVRGATNHFQWERETADRWRATLIWEDGGHRRSRQYRMTRIAPPVAGNRGAVELRRDSL